MLNGLSCKKYYPGKYCTFSRSWDYLLTCIILVTYNIKQIQGKLAEKSEEGDRKNVVILSLLTTFGQAISGQISLCFLSYSYHLLLVA